ncbi:MAG: diguanylate cyclase [Wenzhouxiangellaceae bacterium]|nr:diguanylate cyclase [Wenzhouxiangellaceae bacterium]
MKPQPNPIADTDPRRFFVTGPLPGESALQRGLLGIGLAAAWLAAWMVSAIAGVTDHASVWFPPAGLTLAALTVLGRAAAPYLAIAAVLATFWAVEIYALPASPWRAASGGFLFAAAHLAGYGLGAWLLRRIARDEYHRAPRMILGFLLAAVVCTLLTTFAVLGGLTLTGLMGGDTIAEAWLPFWVGDFVGVIVLAPLFAAVLVKLIAPGTIRIRSNSASRLDDRTGSFTTKVVANVAFVLIAMALAARFRTVESAFLIFFLVVPQMWMTFSEGPFRTVLSLGLISVLIVAGLHLAGLHEYLFIYQFAITIVAITSYFAIAIPVLAAENTELRRQATTDPLTSAATRDVLIRQAGHAIRRAHAHGQPVSLMMIDVDRFKAVNDRYGHAEGDRVLSEVSRTIRERLRGSDVFARFGGDEFAILLPDTDLEIARRLAERLRIAVSEHVFASATDVTVSIGLASLATDEEFRGLFERADEALYEAKQEGRNRTRATA